MFGASIIRRDMAVLMQSIFHFIWELPVVRGCAINCCTAHPKTITNWLAGSPMGGYKTENHLRIFRASMVKKFLCTKVNAWSTINSLEKI